MPSVPALLPLSRLCRRGFAVFSRIVQAAGLLYSLPIVTQIYGTRSLLLSFTVLFHTGRNAMMKEGRPYAPSTKCTATWPYNRTVPLSLLAFSLCVRQADPSPSPSLRRSLPAALRRKRLRFKTI